MVFGWAFDSVRAYLWYYRSEEGYRWSTDDLYRWIHLDFADEHVKNCIEGGILLEKRDANEVFGADWMYAPGAVVWEFAFTERCSLANVVTYMCSILQVRPQVADLPPVSLSIPAV